MPTTKSSKKSTSLNETPEMVSITQSITKDNYRRLLKLAKAKGAQYPQELIRIAISDLLERSGF